MSKEDDDFRNDPVPDYFLEYPSIKNLHQFPESLFSQAKRHFLIEHKIDGANFSILIDIQKTMELQLKKNDLILKDLDYFIQESIDELKKKDVLESDQLKLKIDEISQTLLADLNDGIQKTFFSRNCTIHANFFNAKSVIYILNKLMIKDLFTFFQNKGYSRVQLYGELYGTGVQSRLKYPAPSGWMEAYKTFKLNGPYQFFKCFDIKYWDENNVAHFLLPQKFVETACEFNELKKPSIEFFLNKNEYIFAPVTSYQDIFNAVRVISKNVAPEQVLPDNLDFLNYDEKPPIEGIVLKSLKGDLCLKYVFPYMRDTCLTKNLEKKSLAQNGKEYIPQIMENLTIVRCEKRAADEYYDNWIKFATDVIKDAINDLVSESLDDYERKKLFNEHKGTLINEMKKLYPYQSLANFYSKNK